MNNIPTTLSIVLYIMIFLYGIVIGSFVNVCICRIPRNESIVKVRSHCENCGYQLKWYDLIPIFSYVCLGGKCRKCRTKISAQHLVIEVLNGGLYILIYSVCGFSLETLLYCLAGSALLGLSMIDFQTFEIPVGFNIFLGGLGVIRLITDLSHWQEYVIGFFAVSVILYLIYRVSNGAAMGGGDVKLMAACGLLLGWKLIFLALAAGCILGSVIHLVRMRFFEGKRELAMGPYLSMGIMIAALWGNDFLAWYLSGILY